MAITFTQEDLDNLKEMLVTGVMETEAQGRKLKFRSKDELISLINTIEKSLNGSTSNPETDFQVGGFNRKGCSDEE